MPSHRPFDRSDDALFLAYLVAFFAAWTIYVLIFYPHVRGLGEASLIYALAGIGVRLLIWVLPVVAYIRLADHTCPARYLRLVDRWQAGVLVGLALAIAIFALSASRFGWPRVSEGSVTWNSVLGTSLGVGFFEEIPFRGFILQKLSARVGFFLANLVSSLLFVAIHLPGWLSLHLFTWPVALYVFVFSFVLGLVFRIVGSLWACIVAHSANDFIALVLFHDR
jgi:uncharacterized protein